MWQFIYNITNRANDIREFIYPTKKNVTSLIVSDYNISIISVNNYSTEINIASNENILNYLKHHILHTNDYFEFIIFTKPLFVRFSFRNQIYQICLKGLQSIKEDQTAIKTTPKYLSAIFNSDENENEYNVTEKILEFHGPTKNFFNHIPDAISDLTILMNFNLNHKGKLHTFDMMGCTNIYELS